MTKLSNVQHSQGYEKQSPVFREHRIAEHGRKCLEFGRMLGEVGNVVMEAGEQATEDNLPRWPLQNFMVYLNKADERKHQKYSKQNNTKTLSKGSERSVIVES